nr:hypothetical protein [uncultured Pseudodesulfovibrio sp.]
MIKHSELFLFFSLIVVGALGVITGNMHYWHVPVIYPRIIGGLMMACGAFFLICTIITRQKGTKSIGTYICPKCETAVDFRNVGNHTCPKCQTELEPLVGFYERHPEFKDK